MLSVFYICMLAPNVREQLQAVFSNLLASTEFSTEIESTKKSPAHANPLAEYICRLSVKSWRCSKTCHLYSCLQNTLSRKCTRKSTSLK